MRTVRCSSHLGGGGAPPVSDLAGSAYPGDLAGRTPLCQGAVCLAGGICLTGGLPGRGGVLLYILFLSWTDSTPSEYTIDLVRRLLLRTVNKEETKFSKPDHSFSNWSQAACQKSQAKMFCPQQEGVLTLYSNHHYCN